MSLTTIQTFDGNIVIGGVSPGSSKLKVSGGTSSFQDLIVTSTLTVGGSTDVFVPQGLIIMWAGSTIPNGWSLCDGTNGNPDLRDRFLRSKGDLTTIGDTGGANSLTLLDTQLPSHTHTGSLASAGNHTHSVSLASGGVAHTHTLSLSNTGAHTHSTGVTNNAVHSHQYDSPEVGHTHNQCTLPTSAQLNHRHYNGLKANRTEGQYNQQASAANVRISLSLPLFSNSNRILKTQSSGAHTHTHNLLANADSHTHTAQLPSGGGSHTHNVTVASYTNHIHNINNYILNTSHSHTITDTASGIHTHTATTNSDGQSGSLSILPSFYAVAFIIKD